MNCYNCGQEDSGSYCSQCGHKLKISLNPTLHDILHDAIHEFLHLDGKIFKTIKALLLKPGFLTKEFLRGRRLSYINPLRLYLTLSVCFFIFSNFSSRSEMEVIVNSSSQELTHQQELDRMVLEFNTGTFMDEIIKENIPVFKKGFLSLINDPKKFKKTFTGFVAKALFLLLPVFALIVMFTDFQQRRHYPQYFYFSLHYHAALFAGLLLTMGIGYIYGSILFWWFVWAFIYLVLSLQKIWGDSVKRSLKRSLLVLIIYGFVFILTLASVATVSVYSLGS